MRREGMLALSMVAGCGGAAGIVGVDGRSQALSAKVGQEVTVTLGNVGPGVYGSPPAISTSAVQFLSVEVIPPFNPGGPTQQFRLRAVERGTAVVTFRRVQFETFVSIVEDTIIVR
ncbi:MAG: hypothetical protein ABIY52_10850 [Gemmatimonadaceae bacterium]